MDTEIELKFLVDGDFARHVPNQLAEVCQRVIPQPTRQLINTYYDTEDKLLRQFDIGYRTRSCDGVIEQTIKLAGQAVGGLHQRPEYNLPLAENNPDLMAFAANIWPEGFDVHSVNSRLSPLFTTNFTRMAWVLEVTKDTRVELVFDKGEICAKGQQVEICEIEIELIEGNSEELFKLASAVIASNRSRLGLYSKAARGYQLAANITPQPEESLNCVRIAANMNIEEAFANSLQDVIGFLQKHEASYTAHQDLKSLKRVHEASILIRHLLTLYRPYVDCPQLDELRRELKWLLEGFSWVERAKQIKTITSKKHAFYKKISGCEEVFSLLKIEKSQQPSADEINHLFYSARYNQFLLNLTHLTLTKPWRLEADFNQSILTQPVKEIAIQFLEKNWQEMEQLIKGERGDDNDSADFYSDRGAYLARNLLTGCCFGALFDQDKRQAFRDPWLDLLYGVEQINILQFIAEIITENAPQNDAVHAFEFWLQRKLTSLTEAMDQSRNLAVEQTPYWRL